MRLETSLVPCYFVKANIAHGLINHERYLKSRLNPFSINPAMIYPLISTGLVILHLGFVSFVVMGGLLCLKWRKLIWIHIPAVIWGIVIELSGWICPLTPLENFFRQKAGGSAYEGDFILRYLLPILYPESLTRQIQWLLALAVIVINTGIYYIIIYRRNNGSNS